MPTCIYPCAAGVVSNCVISAELERLQLHGKTEIDTTPSVEQESLGPFISSKSGSQYNHQPLRDFDEYFK